MTQSGNYDPSKSTSWKAQESVLSHLKTSRGDLLLLSSKCFSQRPTSADIFGFFGKETSLELVQNFIQESNQSTRVLRCKINRQKLARLITQYWHIFKAMALHVKPVLSIAGKTKWLRTINIPGQLIIGSLILTYM